MTRSKIAAREEGRYGEEEEFLWVADGWVVQVRWEEDEVEPLRVGGCCVVIVEWEEEEVESLRVGGCWVVKAEWKEDDDANSNAMELREDWEDKVDGEAERRWEANAW